MTKKKKTKKPATEKVPYPAGSRWPGAADPPRPRRPDSVVEDDDVITLAHYEPDDPPPEVAGEEVSKPSGREMVKAGGKGLEISHDEKVRNAARDLVLQAKTAMSRRTGYHPQEVTLTLENEIEVDAAMSLEHQGRGRLFQDPNSDEWCFTFGEEQGPMGGVLKGDTLTDTKD